MNEVSTTTSTTHADNETALYLLLLSARLLHEYNVRVEVIRRWIDRLSNHLGVSVRAVFAYRDVTIIAADGRYLHAEVPEFRNNVAAYMAICEVMDGLCKGHLGMDEARKRLESVQRTAPLYKRWLVAIFFGVATSAFAFLLGGDWGTIIVSGIATGLGLIVRQQLAKRDLTLFAQPFAAGLIGAIFGGLAIRLEWTLTPGLCLIVPALMIVPGPHFINSVDDLLENHLRTSVFRLVLGMSIVFAGALGVILGGWLTLNAAPAGSGPSTPIPITLALDVVLASVAAAGVGISYNSPARSLWISILCGLVGHGIRFLCLKQGMGLAVATLVACIAIGVISDIAVKRLRLPFSAVAFAGAVTMMPGLLLYESIVGAIRLGVVGKEGDATLVTATFAPLFQAILVVSAMTIGLLLGARLSGLVQPRPQS
jgi:uncharacterized membrane protein YjjP (DUF1212 family)